MSIITYHIASDHNGALRTSAKRACDFWNRFVEPSSPRVVRLGTFTSFGNTIARAKEPYQRDGTIYGVVEFNTLFIDRYDAFETTATLIHEIGHTLGIGWGRWMSLFSQKTGKFYKSAIKKVPALEEMRVELDYGPGTTLVHWDEKLFNNELMTGLKNTEESVKPVSIDVMELLGHKVKERLTKEQNLRKILKEMEKMVFSRIDEVIKLNRDVYIQTSIWEEVYSPVRTPIASRKQFDLI